MIVDVERCWSGGERFWFRLTLPGGHREGVRGETWTRKLAAEALDVCEKLYGLPRSRIRFRHR